MRLVFDHRNDAVAEMRIDGLEDLPDLVAAAPGEAPVLHGQSLHTRLAEGGKERTDRLQGVALVGDARPVEDRAPRGGGNGHLGHAGTDVQRNVHRPGKGPRYRTA